MKYGPVRPEELVIVPKGWGYERILHNTDRYCGKELVFEQGKKCSYHYHKLKEETFLVASGVFSVRYNSESKLFPVPDSPASIQEDYDNASTVILSAGDVFHLPCWTRHQMMALTDGARIIEFSSEHFDDDSIRLILGD